MNEHISSQESTICDDSGRSWERGNCQQPRTLVTLGTGSGLDESQWVYGGVLDLLMVSWEMCLFLSQSMLGSCKITVHSVEDEIEASGEIAMEPQTLALGVTREWKVKRNLSEGSRD